MSVTAPIDLDDLAVWASKLALAAAEASSVLKTLGADEPTRLQAVHRHGVFALLDQRIEKVRQLLIRED